MGTMEEISAAINQIDVKKENLRESFLHLQSQSSSSSLISTLNWPDFDSYFTTIRSSLQHKFSLLQTFHPSIDTKPVPIRPELKYLCENSDGLGLRRLISLAPVRQSFLAELPDAYRYAQDAAAMVLDAMEGFYSSGCNDTELRNLRSGCLIMLEGLVHLKPVITIELKKKAMEMAVQWNRNRVCISLTYKGREQSSIGFLLLVGTYGLMDGFSIDEILDCFVIVASLRDTIDLCRQMIPADNYGDLIQKLINKELHIAAVNFSIKLKKTDEFPPVRLLEERKLISMRAIEETTPINKVVTRKEIMTLKAIIHSIDEHHLESEYPKDGVVELVKRLENKVGISKRATARSAAFRKSQLAPVFKKQIQSKPKLNKFNQSNFKRTNFNQIREPRFASRFGAGPSFGGPQSRQSFNFNSNGWISD